VGHRFLAGFDVRAADEIEQDVDAFAGSPFFGGGGEVIKIIAQRVFLQDVFL